MNSRNRKKLEAVEQDRVYATYWLTRDADSATGEPSTFVDVWWSKPVRYEVGDHGAFWLDKFSGLTERHAQWDVATARLFGVVPDDGRMCIRVGDEASTREALTHDLVA